MQTRVNIQRRTRLVLVTFMAAFLLVLFWSVRSAFADLRGTTGSNAALWSLVGLGTGLILLVVLRPILIPWTVVNVRRLWRQAFPTVTRFEPAPAHPMTAPGPSESALQTLMEDSDAAVLRAQEVQEILDAARAIPPVALPAQEREVRG